MSSPTGPTLVNTLKKGGYKIVHLTLGLIITGGILMISLLCLLHQNI